MNILVTGGAGFIGSAVVRSLINDTAHTVLVLDKLTYAGNVESLQSVSQSDRYQFVHGDVCDPVCMQQVFDAFKPQVVMHLAAESHVDRSIDGPYEFIKTNVIGTYQLLEAARFYWNNLSEEARTKFRFHHVSTDEVYGDLGSTEDLFNELSPYSPSSPYSASKASSDHLVRAWHRTYGLPVVITNCSNNYGPYHFPEKFIPHLILSAINGNVLPVYGKGDQIRDWLFVEDHAEALILCATNAAIGETYAIGGLCQKTNIEVAGAVCDLLEELRPEKPRGVNQYRDLISFVEDRPGHDQRYAIDPTKIKEELDWIPKHTFEVGLRKTVKWYLENQTWLDNVLSGGYRLSRIAGTN